MREWVNNWRSSWLSKYAKWEVSKRTSWRESKWLRDWASKIGKKKVNEEVITGIEEVPKEVNKWERK